MSAPPAPATTVGLVARRELRARLRTRGFILPTAVLLAAVIAYPLLQMTVLEPLERTVVGLTGQASAIAGPLRASAERTGQNLDVTRIGDAEHARQHVASGELDVLVSGSPGELRILAESTVDEQLRASLAGISRGEVLDATFARVGVDPARARRALESVTVEVHALERPDAEREQRLAVAMVLLALLCPGIIGYATMVACGVGEEKTNRVAEFLLSGVRPRHLLLGKTLGIGLTGLIQLTFLGTVGLAVAGAAGVLTSAGAAATALLWGLLWYPLGFSLYATVLAGAGSLVSRREELRPVGTVSALLLLAGFAAGFWVLRDPDGTVSTVLSLIPPLSPILLPGRIVTGAASAAEIGSALTLTVATLAVLTRLSGRVYHAAVLRTGDRVRLRDALSPTAARIPR